MWYLLANKEVLLDFLGGSSAALKEADTLPSLSAESREFYLVWDVENPEEGEFPAVVVLNRSEVTDFLAWTASYLLSYMPITSFLRVLDFDEFRELQKITKSVSLGRLTSAWIGGVIGEALEEYYWPGRLKRLSTKTCANTKFFSVGRAKALGFSGGMTISVSQRFDYVKSLKALGFTDSKDDNRFNFIRDYALSVLLQLTSDPDTELKSTSKNWMLLALDSILNQRDGFARFTEKMDAELRGLLNTLRTGGTRESKFESFEKIVFRVKEGTFPDPAESAFILGYSGSLIAPGSFEYWKFLQDLSRSFPGSMIWYAVCAGLHPGSNVLQFSSSLGRKIKKELTFFEYPIQAPRGDIYYSELKVTLGNRNKTNLWTSSNAGQLFVEIGPTIYVLTKWDDGSEVEQSSSSPTSRSEAIQAELFQEKDEKIRKEIASKMEHLISSIKDELWKELNTEYDIRAKKKPGKKRTKDHKDSSSSDK